jgi:hypothetical protein
MGQLYLTNSGANLGANLRASSGQVQGTGDLLCHVIFCHFALVNYHWYITGKIIKPYNLFCSDSSALKLITNRKPELMEF